MAGAELTVQREAVVSEHLESENTHDFDTTIATFGHARYELVATGDVYDGEAAVRAYFAESRRAFPDQRTSSAPAETPLLCKEQWTPQLARVSSAPRIPSVATLLGTTAGAVPVHCSASTDGPGRVVNAGSRSVPCHCQVHLALRRVMNK